MRIVAIFVSWNAGLDVTEAEDVQLDPPCTTSGIDWKQNGPCQQTADEAHGDRDLQISQKQEAIERLVIEDIAIGNLIEGLDPVEQSIGQVWRTLPGKIRRLRSKSIGCSTY